MTPLQPVRRLLGALAALGATTAAWWAGGHYLLALLPARGIDALTTVAVLAVGLAVLAWYALTAAVAVLCLLLRTAGVIWVRGERAVRRNGAPALRRILGGSAGAMLVAGSVLGPAYAEHQHEDLAGVSLTWAPAPDSAEPAPGAGPGSDEGPAEGAAPPDEAARAAAEHTSHDGRQDAPPADNGVAGDGAPSGDPPTDEPSGSRTAPPDRHPSGGHVHVVQRGETLWSIAAQALQAPADDATIAAHWPQWYQANADVIGPDPDLIVPGQELLAPPRSTS